MTEQEINLWMEHFKTCQKCKPVLEWLSFINEIMREVNKPELKIVHVSYIDVHFHPFRVFFYNMLYHARLSLKTTEDKLEFMEALLRATIANAFPEWYATSYFVSKKKAIHISVTHTFNQNIPTIHIILSPEEEIQATVIYSTNKWKDYTDIKDAIRDFLYALMLQELTTKEVL